MVLCECFVCGYYVGLLCGFGEYVELVDEQFVVCDCVGCYIVVDEDVVGVECMYYVEFVFDLVEIVCKLGCVYVFEVVKWLEQYDVEVEVGGYVLDVGW